MTRMSGKFLLGIAILGAGSMVAIAQASFDTQDGVAGHRAVSSGPVILEWTPPALAALSAQATTRSSFTLDRTMLALAAGMIPDSESEAKRSFKKIDGVSVHSLRFGADGIEDESQVDSIRDAYHLRGWKHLVTTTGNPHAKGPIHNGTTDAWLVVDGMNVRGAVILAETPKSLTLITIAGNLSPADLLHLRGHFGIPRFDGDNLNAGALQ
jgi:Domain of unknown function (DUF4252)